MTCKAVGKSSSDNMRWLLNTSCPNWFKYLPVLGICLYVFCFSPGMGPLPWTINAEIYPLWARAKCTGLATSVNWMSNLFVAMTFLTIVNLLGESKLFECPLVCYYDASAQADPAHFCSTPSSRSSVSHTSPPACRRPAAAASRRPSASLPDPGVPTGPRRCPTPESQATSLRTRCLLAVH